MKFTFRGHVFDKSKIDDRVKIYRLVIHDYYYNYYLYNSTHTHTIERI